MDETYSLEEVMNRTVRILATVSLLLVAAAIVMGRVGMKAGAGIVLVADPTELMSSGTEEPGAAWIGIGMVVLLAGISTGLATIRYWMQTRTDMKEFSRRASDIIPR